MSRSYKKNPVFKGAPTHGKWGKRFANRSVRHHPDLPSGRAYAKIFNQRNIHRVVTWETLNEAYHRWSSTLLTMETYGHQIETLQQVKRWWAKYHHRK